MMITRFGSHLRHHSVAYGALFVALGGTALALPGRNTVDSGDIKTNAVKSRQAKESSFKGLIHGNGKAVKKNVVADQGGFLPTPIPLVKVPTFGQVELIFCGDSAQGQQMRVRLLSSDTSTPFFAVNQVTSSVLPVGTGKPEFIDFGGGSFSAGGGEPMIAQAATADLGAGLVAKWDFTMWRDSGRPRSAHVTVSGINGLFAGDKCQVSAQGEIFD